MYTDLGRRTLDVRVVPIRVVLLGQVNRPVSLPEQPTVLQHQAPINGTLRRQPQSRAQIAVLLFLDCMALPHVLLDALEVRAVALAELAHRLDDDLAEVARAAHLQRLRLQAARVL